MAISSELIAIAAAVAAVDIVQDTAPLSAPYTEVPAFKSPE